MDERKSERKSFFFFFFFTKKSRGVLSSPRVFLLSFYRHCEGDIRKGDSPTVRWKKKERERRACACKCMCKRTYTHIRPIDSLLRTEHARKDAYAGRRTPKRAKLLLLLLVLPA